MFIENHYIITQEVMYMTGYYDRLGNLCTKVKELNRTLIVNKSPLEVLDYSIRCIGFDLRGAIETSKWLLDKTSMCPIMVNPIDRIVLFPTRAYHHEDNIFFNPQHITRTRSIKRNTSILFSDGSSMVIPASLTSFNTKLQTAEQLEKMTVHSANKPFTFVLNPKKKRGGVYVRITKKQGRD